MAGKSKGDRVSTKPPSGTRDFLPEDVARRRHVVEVVQRTYEEYGFVPLETPAFENLTTLLGKYGEEGDQLLFRLLHRRDALARALERDDVGEADLAGLGLRYDLTVPLARVVAQHRDLPRFFKRYQIQPVWRADRPGRGRFREFYQCDVDIVGSRSPLAEAEVCAAVCQVLQRLGFEAFTLRLNHRALLRGLIRTAGIDEQLEQTALVAVDKLDKIGPEGVQRELAERGVSEASSGRLLALLERGDGAAETIARLRERLTDDQGLAALAELEELGELLASTPAGPHVQLSPELARGLSYYTGPIFEINIPDLSGSLGGGGRYDELIGMFGKQPIPAVGCSLGLERILLVMQQRQMYPELAIGPQVMVCWIDARPAQVLDVAHRLRAAALRVETYPQSAKLGKQLQYADSPAVAAPIAAIVGEQEVSDGQLTLKHLASGVQQTVPIAEAAALVQQWLRAPPTADHSPE